MNAFACPFCTKTLSVRGELRERKLRCHACGARVQLHADGTTELLIAEPGHEKKEQGTVQQDLSFHCPKCWEELKAPRSAAGTSIACSGCGEPVKVDPPVELSTELEEEKPALRRRLPRVTSLPPWIARRSRTITLRPSGAWEIGVVLLFIGLDLILGIIGVVVAFLLLLTEGALVLVIPIAYWIILLVLFFGLLARSILAWGGALGLFSLYAFYHIYALVSPWSDGQYFSLHAISLVLNVLNLGLLLLCKLRGAYVHTEKRN